MAAAFNEVATGRAASDAAPSGRAASDAAPSGPAALDAAPSGPAALDAAPLGRAAFDAAPSGPAALDAAPSDSAALDAAPSGRAAPDAEPLVLCYPPRGELERPSNKARIAGVADDAHATAQKAPEDDFVMLDRKELPPVIAERPDSVAGVYEHVVTGHSQDRKKDNPLYSLRIIEEADSCRDPDDSTSSVKRQLRRSPFFWHLVAIAIIAVGAVLLAAVVAASIIGTAAPIKVLDKAVNATVEEKLARLQEQVFNLEARLQRDIEAFGRIYSSLNLSVVELDTDVVRLATNLSSVVTTFSALVANYSMVSGPQGQPGLNGSQSPPGAANFSACVVHSSTTRDRQTVLVPDLSMYRNMYVMSATCAVISQTGSSVVRWELETAIANDGRIQYRCICGDTTDTCTIHYWMCPYQQ